MPALTPHRLADLRRDVERARRAGCDIAATVLTADELAELLDPARAADPELADARDILEEVLGKRAQTQPRLTLRGLAAIAVDHLRRELAHVGSELAEVRAERDRGRAAVEHEKGRAASAESQLREVHDALLCSLPGGESQSIASQMTTVTLARHVVDRVAELWGSAKRDHEAVREELADLRLCDTRARALLAGALGDNEDASRPVDSLAASVHGEMVGVRKALEDTAGVRASGPERYSLPVLGLQVYSLLRSARSRAAGAERQLEEVRRYLQAALDDGISANMTTPGIARAVASRVEDLQGRVTRLAEQARTGRPTHRLSLSQRAMCVAQVRRDESFPRHLVLDALDVLAAGVPALIESVVRGDIVVSTAAELAKLPHDRQRDLLEREVGMGEQSPAAVERSRVGKFADPPPAPLPAPSVRDLLCKPADGYRPALTREDVEIIAEALEYLHSTTAGIVERGGREFLPAHAELVERQARLLEMFEGLAAAGGAA